MPFLGPRLSHAWHSTNLTKRALLRRATGSVIIFAILVIVVSLVSSTTIGLLIASVNLLANSLLDRTSDYLLGKRDEPELHVNPLELGPTTPFNPTQFFQAVWSSAEDLTGPTTILRYPTPLEKGEQVESKIKQNELYARFGIIRFSNTGSDAINCRAEARCEVEVHGSDKKVWLECGYLSWFSKAKRSSLIEMDKVDILEMNKLLANPGEDIYQKQEKDLQVCFTLLGGNSLIMCSDGRFYAVPYDETKPARLKIELTVTAQKYPVTKKLFEVTADNRSIIIRELNS